MQFDEEAELAEHVAIAEAIESVVRRLDPGVADADAHHSIEAVALTSIAISLKRIADALGHLEKH